MEHSVIYLSTREELNIYMSPVRQELLRALRLNGGPMTPKGLADRLGVSPSSVQHHLKKLLSLGVVEVDHQEIINGITATYYRESFATVRIGLERGEEAREEWEIMVTDMVNRTFQGFLKLVRSAPKDMSAEELGKHGMVINGVVSLSPKEREELLELVNEFLLAHDAATPERTERWEYALLAYRPEETL